MYNISAFNNVDIRTVDPDCLVNIEDVHIKTELPKMERILDFLRQIKNPYCYKCGETIVKVTFIDTDITLEDRLKHYISSL